MFAIARAIARRPLPALCVVGVIGFLAYGHKAEEKPADPWSAAPVAAETDAKSDNSLLAKAVDTAADYAEKADGTGTVAKVRGSVETTADSWDNSAGEVAKATGN